MDLSRFHPHPTGTPDAPRPDAWPRWWWSRLELSANTHRSFGHTAPLTRGWLHRAAALLWPVYVVWLALQATPGAARVGAIAFGAAMQAMFTASAVTHLRRWDVWTTEVLFRLDHTGIFLAIAGSVTPFALLGLDGWMTVAVLTVTLVATVVGIVVALWPSGTPVGFGNTAFITAGLVVVPFVPFAFDRLGVGGSVLLLTGGATYIVGAVLLAYQRPRLSPRVFGYHELWHLLVVLGVVQHAAMVQRYLLPAA